MKTIFKNGNYTNDIDKEREPRAQDDCRSQSCRPER
jgi:hypothetical protein